MNILPILSILAGAAVCTAPLALDAATDATAHPHYPMVTSIAGVKGNVTVSWFTVPHNPEQVKKAGPNYLWNRGFSLKTDVALKVGSDTVPAGTYAMGFQLDGEGKSWSVVLSPRKVSRLQRQIQQGKRRGDDISDLEAELKELAKKGIKKMSLTSKTFEGKHAEHMAIYSVNYGYKTGGRRDPDPISGVEGEYRISFGDLHTSFAFEEVFATKKPK